MPKLTHKNAITSVTLRVKIVSSSDGSPLTGLTYNSSGLIIAVIKDDEATTTAYTQAAGNIQDISTLGTYADPSENKCRFKELDSTNHPGIYEIHIADTIWNDTSARSAIVSVSGVSGMLAVDAEIQLVKYDPLDSVRLGLTALPNAAADAAGGLPISDAGGLDLDTLDSNVAAVLVDTAEIGAAGAGLTEAGGTGDHLTAVPWNASWDAEVQSEVQDAIEANHLDHLLAVDYDPASKPGVATALLNELVESDGGVSRFTENALENVAGSTTGAAIAAAILDLAAGVETGLTVRQHMRLSAAALYGKVSGGGTGTNTFRDTNDGTNRIVSTVDSSGNRTAVVLDAT